MDGQFGVICKVQILVEEEMSMTHPHLQASLPTGLSSNRWCYMLKSRDNIADFAVQFEENLGWSMNKVLHVMSISKTSIHKFDFIEWFLGKMKSSLVEFSSRPIFLI